MHGESIHAKRRSSIDPSGNRVRMRMTPEQRFARVAAMIGDPTRARMLAVLLGGGYFSADEIPRAAGNRHRWSKFDRHRQVTLTADKNSPEENK